MEQYASILFVLLDLKGSKKINDIRLFLLKKMSKRDESQILPKLNKSSLKQFRNTNSLETTGSKAQAIRKKTTNQGTLYKTKTKST